MQQAPSSGTSVKQQFQQFGEQLQSGAQQFGEQVQQSTQKAAQNSQNWLCQHILPPKHDAGKALAIAAAALIFFVVGAALGAWRSWFAIVLGIAVAAAIFIGVYVGAAKYDYASQERCYGKGDKPWWEVTCGSSSTTNPPSSGSSGSTRTLLPSTLNQRFT